MLIKNRLEDAFSTLDCYLGNMKVVYIDQILINLFKIKNMTHIFAIKKNYIEKL